MTDAALSDRPLPAKLSSHSGKAAEPSLLRECVAKAREGLRLSAERSMPLPDGTIAAVIATGRALERGTLTAEQEERFWTAYARVCSSTTDAARLRQRYNIAFVVLLLIVLGVQSVYISTASLIDGVKEQWSIVLDYENAHTPQCAGTDAPTRETDAKRPQKDGAAGCPTRLVTEPDYRLAQTRLLSYDHLLHSATPLLAGMTSGDDPQGKGEQIERFRHFVKFGALNNMRRFLELFILPALYGALGACAFVLRRFTADNAHSAIQDDSGIRHGLRISIGVIAGLAVHWLTHQPDGMGGGTIAESLTHLSRVALSFVAGYGSEVVFHMLDRVVAALAPGREDSAPASHPHARTGKAAAETTTE